MIKWFLYIILALLCLPGLSFCEIRNHAAYSASHTFDLNLTNTNFLDTLALRKQRQQETEDKKKVKEIAKAKRQPKPEKVDDEGNIVPSKITTKPKRQRRPAGLERPPEIPRRNGN